MRMGGRPGAPRALAVPTGPLGSAGPPQTAANIFSCIPERLTENWLEGRHGAEMRRAKFQRHYGGLLTVVPAPAKPQSGPFIPDLGRVKPE